MKKTPFIVTPWQEYTKPPTKRRLDMTIGIGAICSWSGNFLLLGVSDRMLTARDTTFEPPQTKVASVTDRIAILVSGPAAAYSTIVQDVMAEVQKQKTTAVRDVANICAKAFASYRLAESEAVVLAPLGLSLKDYIAQRNAHHYYSLRDELRQYDIDTELIVMGIDSLGCHLYLIHHPGIAQCNDDVGFVAIGSGGRHANLRFMEAKYTNRRPLEEALFLAYAAKRRAEVAPFVGRHTDMLVIDTASTPPILQLAWGSPLLDQLGAIYETSVGEKKEADSRAFAEFKTLLQAKIAESKTASQASPPPVPSKESI